MAQVVEVDGGRRWLVSPLNVQSFVGGDVLVHNGFLLTVCGTQMLTTRSTGTVTRLCMTQPGSDVILRKTWPVNTPLMRVVGGRGGGSR